MPIEEVYSSKKLDDALAQNPCEKAMELYQRAINHGEALSLPLAALRVLYVDSKRVLEGTSSTYFSRDLEPRQHPRVQALIRSLSFWKGGTLQGNTSKEALGLALEWKRESPFHALYSLICWEFSSRAEALSCGVLDGACYSFQEERGYLWFPALAPEMQMNTATLFYARVLACEPDRTLYRLELPDGRTVEAWIPRDALWDEDAPDPEVFEEGAECRLYLPTYYARAQGFLPPRGRRR